MTCRYILCCCLLLLATVVSASDELFAYSFEVWLRDRPGDAGDYWPIVEEYNQPSAFKAGNFSVMSTSRRYVKLLLTPYGYLVGVRGNRNGFDSNGNLGNQPSSESKSGGFEIQDDFLLYQGGSNWTACPITRDGTVIYTLKYASNCTMGYSTNITLVGTQTMSTVSGYSTLVSDESATTTLSENSFKSATQTMGDYASPVVHFSILQAFLSLLVQFV